MQEKSFKPLQIVHLFLILSAAVMTVIGMFRLFAGDAFAGIVPDPGAIKPGLCIFAGVYFIHLISLLCAAIYTTKGYVKSDAIYYQLLIGLMVLSSIGGTIGIAMYQGFSAVQLLMIPRVILLGLLLFGKDLGRKKSFIFYHIILAIDIITCIATLWVPGPVTSKVGSIFARILIAGTLGLAISGKYQDKSARGTE